MYFSEFLETCTIGWASFCESGVGVGKEGAFFILVGGDGTHLPHPRRSLYTPPVSPCLIQHARNACTSQAARQTVPDAGQTMQGKARTLHRVDRTSGGRWRLRNVSETVQIWTDCNGPKK